MTFSSPDSVQASDSRRAWAMACDDSGAGINVLGRNGDRIRAVETR